jgi:L-iditol 2-dehydrogenase
VSATMEALVVLEPNHFEIRQVEVPTPGPGEVLARVRAVSICGTDAHLVHGDYPGFWPPSFPFIPGHEWAGEIAALGPGAERYGWSVGDRVAGTSHDACGVCQKCVEGRYNLCENYGRVGLHKQYGHSVQGADATFVVQGVKTIFPLPDGLTFDEGAVIDPASIALHVANRGNVAPGDTVAILGAGAIGLLAGDAARIRGAARVVLVERNELRLGKAAAMGSASTWPSSAPGSRSRSAGPSACSAAAAAVPPSASPPSVWRSRCRSSCSMSSSWSARARRPVRCGG